MPPHDPKRVALGVDHGTRRTGFAAADARGAAPDAFRSAATAREPVSSGPRLDDAAPLTLVSRTSASRSASTATVLSAASARSRHARFACRDRSRTFSR